MNKYTEAVVADAAIQFQMNHTRTRRIKNYAATIAAGTIVADSVQRWTLEQHVEDAIRIATAIEDAEIPSGIDKPLTSEERQRAIDAIKAVNDPKEDGHE